MHNVTLGYLPCFGRVVGALWVSWVTAFSVRMWQDSVQTIMESAVFGDGWLVGWSSVGCVAV